MPRRAPIPVSDNLGERLARFRKERGVTQAELARRLGVKQAHISAYERGLVRLHGELIVQVAQILRISSDELLGIKRVEEPSSPEMWKLRRRLREIEALPTRELVAVVQTLDGFLAKNRERAAKREASARGAQNGAARSRSARHDSRSA